MFAIDVLGFCVILELIEAPTGWPSVLVLILTKFPDEDSNDVKDDRLEEKDLLGKYPLSLCVSPSIALETFDVERDCSPGSTEASGCEKLACLRAP